MTPQTKLSGPVVRRYRLIPKYGLGDLPKAKGSPTVAGPNFGLQKLAYLSRGYSGWKSFALSARFYRFGWCFKDILT
jgi:hypothetical protein